MEGLIVRYEDQGVTLEMRVPQLPSAPRVALQVPSGVEARYWVSVQV